MLDLCIKIAKLLESLRILSLPADYGVSLLEIQLLSKENNLTRHLETFYHLLVDYKNKRPNYFGTFNESIYITQLKLMYDGITEKFLPQGDLVFCMFWKKYFTKHETTISFFIHAFNLLFGEHNFEQI